MGSDKFIYLLSNESKRKAGGELRNKVALPLYGSELTSSTKSRRESFNIIYHIDSRSFTRNKLRSYRPLVSNGISPSIRTEANLITSVAIIDIKAATLKRYDQGLYLHRTRGHKAN